MSDLILRQSAIDALYHHFPHMTREECAAILHEVGDVETEIVRCRNCKHWLHGHQCIELSVYGTIETLSDEHCSRAERREDAAD